MRTILTGLPYFSEYIGEKLNHLAGKDKYTRLDTYNSSIDRIRCMLLMPFTDVVYSINGATHGSKVIDMAIRLRKRIVFHWVGSDVMQAKEDYELNNIVPDYISRVVHVTDTPWLVDELAGIGIEAKFLPLSCFPMDQQADRPLPCEFSILSYIPQAKEKFYGLDHLLKLAERFPEIQIRIAGLASTSWSLPRNISLLGWVGNMQEEILRSTVCVRMPEHDGLSFFVLEALANQRYVVYNQRFDQCSFANDTQALLERITELIARFERAELKSNYAGRDYVVKNFNETNVVANIRSVLHG